MGEVTPFGDDRKNWHRQKLAYTETASSMREVDHRAHMAIALAAASRL